MREIEFRAYCPEKKCMAYQGTPDLETIQSFMFHWGDKILMQYTGFKDRNGKKVYEGDIVNHKNWCGSYEESPEEIYDCNQGIVKFKEGAYYPRYINEDCEDFFYSYKVFDLEVVGNIFENPEILNKCW
ncbi:Conserved hypothetical protein CHP1671 [uncultured Caudovirales phage]|uniref:YopX protein domain-containing protein n=1 Tax=uncultured Caudovirales phage TaxID=2100421 RepID=A0A6J5N3A7_9CAUD|nr:Conserved hypothetical protein CHP1671 [uncultured Caudovirales phage]